MTGTKYSAVVVIGAVVSAAVANCGDVPDPQQPPELNFETFRREIEPVVTERCGNPTTCHGASGRPYELYVRRAHRRDPADVYRDPPLTDAEHRANFRRTRSFTAETPVGRELLVKPLAEAHGGVPHDGDAVFEDRRDRDYRRIRRWIAEGSESDGGNAP